MENKHKPKCAQTLTSVNQIKQGFKQWKQCTSASPSNRHLGHYKSLLVTYGKYKDDNEDISKIIWNIIAILINAALFTSILLSHRMKVFSITIEN